MIKIEFEGPVSIPVSIARCEPGQVVCRLGTDCRQIVVHAPNGSNGWAKGNALLDALNSWHVSHPEPKERYHVVGRLRVSRDYKPGQEDPNEQTGTSG